MSAKPDPAGYRIAFEEGVRALNEQQAATESFRTRAGLLLSAAAIVTSFFGSEALGEDTTWTWIAIGAFILLGFCVVAILFPRGDWEYASRPSLIIRNYVEHPTPLDEPQIQRDLALHMDRSYVANRGRLRELIWALRLASIFLALEVVAWVVDLAGRT